MKLRKYYDEMVLYQQGQYYEDVGLYQQGYGNEGLGWCNTQEVVRNDLT